MNENIKITQKSAPASHTPQIAVQNNYNGISAEAAAEMALKLFMDNFPKLEDVARTVAKQRAEELCKGIIDKLGKEGKVDFSEFSDPDMQFILNKAQQEYARFGTKELYNLLCEIIVSRVNYNNDYYMKVLFDEAVEIAKSLSSVHLNYLSLIFFSKHTYDSDIKTIEQLAKTYEHFCTIFPVPHNIKDTVPFLILMKTLLLNLNDPYSFLAEAYGFDLETVQKSLPLIIQYVHCDYGLSPLGYILAIINARPKVDDPLPFDIWLKPLIQTTNDTRLLTAR